MDGKIEHRVCIKFCLKLLESATETPEMLREAFGVYSLSRTAVFERHSRFESGRVSVEVGERSGQPSISKTTENIEKIDNSSTMIVADQSMSSRTPLGSVRKFSKRS
jgi:hypothetical protein